MGADAFHVCYGLRWDIDVDDDAATSALERRSDPRQAAAKRHGLDSWWGITTDESRDFLLIGKLFGDFGWEGVLAGRLDSSEVAPLMEDTSAKLRVAGFTEQPAWHFQFEPDR